MKSYDLGSLKTFVRVELYCIASKLTALCDDELKNGRQIDTLQKRIHHLENYFVAEIDRAIEIQEEMSKRLKKGDIALQINKLKAQIAQLERESLENE